MGKGHKGGEKPLRHPERFWDEELAMIDRLGPYLASRPRRAAVLVLTLAVALILVLAGLVLELSHFGQAPYPSEDLGFSLVDGGILYTQGPVVHWWNQTSNETNPSTPYLGAKAAFGCEGFGWGTFPFGQDPALSADTGFPSTEHRDWGGSIGLSVELTDLTSNGFFDEGDTLLFMVSPLEEDTVCFFALAFYPHGTSFHPTCFEMSYVIHDGELHSWRSDRLPDETPWYTTYY